jgi:hypothetical protein
VPYSSSEFRSKFGKVGLQGCSTGLAVHLLELLACAEVRVCSRWLGRATPYMTVGIRVPAICAAPATELARAAAATAASERQNQNSIRKVESVKQTSSSLAFQMGLERHIREFQFKRHYLNAKHPSKS